MKRRALLVALAPLTAGCFGSTQAQSDEPAETPSATPTETPTATPTETPTATPTETPEPAVSGDRKEAIDKIHTAQNQFKDAVYIYTGGVSDELTDVSADASDFDDRSVLLKLSDVRTAINEAQRAAVTTEQKRTAESLHKIHRFLTHATDLQAWLIEGHDAVAETYDAIDNDDYDDDDDEEAIEDGLDRLERTVENASDPLEVVAGIDSVVTESTGVIGVDEYEEKQTQFEHEMTVLEQLHDALSTIQSAREELDAARTKADNSEYYTAEKAAGRAADTLYDTVRDLDDLATDPPSRADAFEDQIEDVLALAEDYEAEADNLQDRYD